VSTMPACPDAGQESDLPHTSWCAGATPRSATCQSRPVLVPGGNELTVQAVQHLDDPEDPLPTEYLIDVSRADLSGKDIVLSLDEARHLLRALLDTLEATL